MFTRVLEPTGTMVAEILIESGAIMDSSILHRQAQKIYSCQDFEPRCNIINICHTKKKSDGKWSEMTRSRKKRMLNVEVDEAKVS